MKDQEYEKLTARMETAKRYRMAADATLDAVRRVMQGIPVTDVLHKLGNTNIIDASEVRAVLLKHLQFAQLELQALFEET